MIYGSPLNKLFIERFRIEDEILEVRKHLQRLEEDLLLNRQISELQEQEINKYFTIAKELPPGIRIPGRTQ